MDKQTLADMRRLVDEMVAEALNATAKGLKEAALELLKESAQRSQEYSPPLGRAHPPYSKTRGSTFIGA
jgi:hypothetical protein